MPHAPTDPNHAATSPARPGRALVTSVAVVVVGLAIALIAFEVSVYPTKLVAQSRHQALPAMVDQLDAPAEIAVTHEAYVFDFTFSDVCGSINGLSVLNQPSANICSSCRS